jgi:type IV pilus assembly protein PilQ
MKPGLLAWAAVGLLAAPARTTTSPGDVTAVSVFPAPGRAEVVIDVSGAVEVSDFVLANPARLVLDLAGARLVAPMMQYDGVPRAGIRNVRYGQFRPDVVRVVLELDETRDYVLTREAGLVRVSFESAQSFEAWSSDLARRAPLPSAPEPQPRAAAAREPEPPAPQQPVQQPRISVTFDRASINDVVANFAAFSGRSIIVGKDVAGDVTAEIRDQPWDYAFYAILAGQGLSAQELPGGIIRVDSRTNLAAQDSIEQLVTRRIKINYARALALETAARGVISARGRAVADTTTNSIIVTDVESRIARVDSFIRNLDQRTPQVAIQARIIFVDRTDLEELGLRYDLGTNDQFFNRLIQRADLAADPTGATPFDRSVTVVDLGGNAVAAIGNASERLTAGNPALELVYSTVIGNFALSAFLDALQQVRLADVQAEPQVTVTDNRQAVLFVGERTPIRIVDVASAGAAGGAVARANVTFQETGIKLTVTPHVVPETREVLMSLKAERSSVTPSPVSDIGAVFSTQEGSTELLVRDGETAVIGGLTVTEVTVAKTGIPFLVDLPILGRLFGFRASSERRRDLLILVTPHIVDDLSTVGTGDQIRR